MKANYMKLAGVVNIPVRLAMGFGVGLFVRKVVQTTNTNYESNPAKVATWFGTICTIWALAHAVDSWCNDTIVYLKECWELENEIRNMEE